MSYYSNMPVCSACGRKTRAFSKRSEELNNKNKAWGMPKHQLNCTLDECEAPPMCHAKIGIGVCTLGARCCYNEGHPGPHSYYPEGSYGCNKHKRCNEDGPIV